MSSVVAGSRTQAPPWRPHVLVLVALVLVVLLSFRGTAAGMVAIWSRSDTFAHCFLVPPLVAWLAWRQRERLRSLTPVADPRWLFALAAAAVLWLLGELAAANAAQQLGLVAMLVALVPAVLGTPVARAIMFALGFAFFAVPVGDFLIPPMMVWTADFTVFALRLTGIPVLREGQQLVLPSGHWEVVEACSGVRYLMASAMVGTLYAHLRFRTARRRLAFVAVALAVPIVGNWLRAYLTVLLGHLTDNRLAAGADHLVYGWIFFGVLIAAMFAIGNRWSDPEPPARTLRGPMGGRAVPLAAVAALALVVVVAPRTVMWNVEHGESREAPVLGAPQVAAGWREAHGVSWRPAFAGAAAEMERSYVGPGGVPVGLYVAYYRRQSNEHKLVSSDNVLVKSEDKAWSQVDQGARALDLAGGRVQWRTAHVQRQGMGTGLVAWQTYWVGGRWVAGDAAAKAWGSWDRLLGHGDDAAVLVAFAPENEGEGHRGEAAIEGFLRANFDALQAQLRRTHGGTVAPEHLSRESR